MPKIIFLPHSKLCPEGAVIENIKSGESICDIACQNGIEIEHACEKSCACTTCHIHIREGGESLNEACELEGDLLDKAWGLDMDSRLSCQTIITDQDLVVEIPKHTINMVSEAK
jgi:2Fe-2S ferredoxin